MLTFRGGGKRDWEALLPPRWAAWPPLPATVPPLPAFCSTYAGIRGKAAVGAWLRCAGARGSCRADFPQRGSAAALRRRPLVTSRTLSYKKVQTPALPGRSLAFGCGELSLSETPAAPGRSPRRGAEGSAARLLPSKLWLPSTAIQNHFL